LHRLSQSAEKQADQIRKATLTDRMLGRTKKMHEELRNARQKVGHEKEKQKQQETERDQRDRQERQNLARQHDEEKQRETDNEKRRAAGRPEILSDKEINDRLLDRQGQHVATHEKLMEQQEREKEDTRRYLAKQQPDQEIKDDHPELQRLAKDHSHKQALLSRDQHRELREYRKQLEQQGRDHNHNGRSAADDDETGDRQEEVTKTHTPRRNRGPSLQM